MKNKGKQSGERFRKLEADNKLLKERLGNLEAWALGNLKDQRGRDDLLDKVATITVLLIKEALGRELSPEEVAGLTEALDGPSKGETDGVTSQSAAGDSAPADSGHVQSAE